MDGGRYSFGRRIIGPKTRFSRKFRVFGPMMRSAACGASPAADGGGVGRGTRRTTHGGGGYDLLHTGAFMQSGAALSDGPAEVRDCAATRIASTLQLEILVAVEDVEGVLHGVVGQRDGADGLRQAHGLVQIGRAHV